MKTTGKNRTSTTQNAFTFGDLVAILAMVSIMAIIFLPLLFRARLIVQRAACESDLHQLTMAFKMYSNENNGYFPLNIRTAQYNDGGSPWSAPWQNWVAGDENYGGASDNTNYALLTNPQATQLAPYEENPKVYRCPADQSKSGPIGGNQGTFGPPRIRSYSMSLAVGCSDLAGDPAVDPNHILNALDVNQQYEFFNKQSSVVGLLQPAGLWALIDENPDSIDDGNFAFIMPFLHETEWLNSPSKLHGNAGAIAYEDGHAEMHHWLDPQYIATTTYQQHADNEQSAIPGGDPDIFWMASHTTVPVP